MLNLRVAVTERARKLRAQYALQSQGLRTRIEIRVNRIPTSLRSVTMGDLLAKYQPRPDGRPDKDPAAATARPAPRGAPTSQPPRSAEPMTELENRSAVLPKTRGKKRPRY